MNGVISAVVTFFSHSAKRMNKLKYFIDSGVSKSNENYNFNDSHNQKIKIQN